MNSCIICGKLVQRKSYKYCSNKCQREKEYKEYIIKWQQGLVSGNRGLSTRNISQYVKRYLIEKFGEKCARCGWDEKHLTTGTVPLEIDHINGNAEDSNKLR